MNLKSKIILLAVVFFLSITGSVYSQGVFKNNPAPSEESTTSTKSPGVFAAGSGKGQPGDAAPGTQGAVGEGLAILSILSSCYFMLKRRKRRNEP
ncbi:MAG: hypothetical protein LBR97_07640 [Dysgonamonadaceae bacterium]|jgi:hypothetical protein|nr:hypothetical protein [Dysgonamonadaceae bacterium]